MEKISVVIVASLGLEKVSRRETLAECLRSLGKQTYPKSQFEVVVVDSGSLLGKEFFDEAGRELPINLRYFDPGLGNIGPSRGRNIGIRRALFEIIAFTDDDSRVPGDWLERLAAGYENNPGVAAVGGLTLPPESARSNIFAYFEKHLYLRYLKGGKLSTYFSLKRDEHPVFTGNISYRKDVLIKAGLFDESYPPFISGEDGDLKEKVLRSGGFFLFLPLIVEHRCSYNFRRFFFQQISKGASILRYRKRHGLENRRSLIFLRIVSAVFSLPWLILKERFNLRFVVAEWLSLIIRNLGKIYYYEKV